MAVTVRMEPIASTLDVMIRQDLSPQAQSEALATFAREQIADASARNARATGRRAAPRVAVDGREGGSLSQVRPDGVIVAEWGLIDDALWGILEMLRQRSPVRSGDYRRGHRLFADRREIVAGAAIPPAAEYVILNVVPYARKIEVGKTRSGRDFVIQVPPRIYERTATEAKRRFGNMVKITLGYRSPIMGYQSAGSRGARHSRRGGAERASRVPAIVVTVR